MLFSPIGAQKPIRIQGCFVSDGEIESIVNFLKKSQDSDYDENVMDEIEKNAVAEHSGDDAGNAASSDPMMNDAIKCVVEARTGFYFAVATALAVRVCPCRTIDR